MVESGRLASARISCLPESIITCRPMDGIPFTTTKTNAGPGARMAGCVAIGVHAELRCCYSIQYSYAQVQGSVDPYSEHYIYECTALYTGPSWHTKA